MEVDAVDFRGAHAAIADVGWRLRIGRNPPLARQAHLPGEVNGLLRLRLRGHRPHADQPAARHDAVLARREDRAESHFPRILVVAAGRNSSRSATMPTSATRNIWVFGFLLMATMNGLPLSPARCWNEPLMPQAT